MGGLGPKYKQAANSKPERARRIAAAINSLIVELIGLTEVNS